MGFGEEKGTKKERKRRKKESDEWKRDFLLYICMYLTEAFTALPGS